MSWPEALVEVAKIAGGVLLGIVFLIVVLKSL